MVQDGPRVCLGPSGIPTVEEDASGRLNFGRRRLRRFGRPAYANRRRIQRRCRVEEAALDDVNFLIHFWRATAAPKCYSIHDA